LTRAPGLRGQELSKSAPRALSEEQRCRLPRLAERASARDRAIVVVLLYTGLSLAELVALDVDDVRGVSAQGARRRPGFCPEARKRCLRRRRQIRLL
jgi:site-specific recombinase XerC